MKKSFIIAGEASGDTLAGWYIDRFCSQEYTITAGIGGQELEKRGVPLYAHYQELNLTGILELLTQLPRLLIFMHKLVAYLIAHEYTELIVIDFPGFNLHLSKIIKKKAPNISILYLAPPQLWCWGSWRIKSLKRYIDRIIVLYAFEQEYYAQRGLAVEFYGTPLYDRLKVYVKNSREKNVSEKISPTIALLPGSRPHEIQLFLPLFLTTVRALCARDKTIQLCLPITNTGKTRALIDSILDKEPLRARITVITQEDEKYQQLSQAFCALTKPGTITLELALLAVPSIVAFKTSWLTYTIARQLVTVTAMSLPNLFSSEIIFSEYIQKKCSSFELAQALEKLYISYTSNSSAYKNYKEKILRFSRQFEKQQYLVTHTSSLDERHADGKL